MRLGRFWMLFVASAALPPGLAGAGEYGRMQDIRGWQVGPYFNDDGTPFSCDAIYDYGNGIFRFEINNDGITVSMTSDEWDLKDNGNVPVRLRVGRYSGRFAGYTTADDDFIWVDVGWDADFWDAIKASTEIEFEGKEDTWTAGLYGSRAAADALEDCIDRHFSEANNGSKDPFN
jgi:hypothetical protein